MTTEQKQDLVRKALTLNVNLTDEEYAKLIEKADQQTKNNGVEGRAPRSEAVRQRRMSMNYYGTSLNISLNVMVAIEEMHNTLKALLAETKTQNEILAKALNIDLVDDEPSAEGEVNKINEG